MIARQRAAIAALVLSAAGLVGILSDEQFVGKAMVPTKNDRPTVGFGSTFREDGSAVRLGDTIEPVQAIRRSLSHIGKDEARLRQCVTGELTQGEYDVLVGFAYQYGTAATCGSSIVRFINDGRYAESCNAYTRFKYSGGYDCSIPGNRICAGVWARNLERRDKCLKAGA
jgi:GH24 family phage-related lysozyme (muramidase)